MNLTGLHHITNRKKIIKKIYKNCDLKTKSRPSCVRKKLSTTSIEKWYFLSKLLILDMTAKLSTFIQISVQTSDFFTEDFLKFKKGLELNDKNFSFVILHKLAKLHYQIVFTSQEIQQNASCVLCFGIWQRHDIWISEKWKTDSVLITCFLV